MLFSALIFTFIGLIDAQLLTKGAHKTLNDVTFIIALTSTQVYQHIPQYLSFPDW